MKIHLLFGMGDCQRIKQILATETRQDYKLFVYEPYTENYKTYKKLLPTDDRLMIYIYRDFVDMVDLLCSMFDTEKPSEVGIETLDQYAIQYPKELDEFEQNFNDAMEIYNSSQVTKERFSKSLEENLEKNMKYIRLGKKLSSIQTKGNVAYVIAAGSSLDNNIDELKNAHGMIIATDTALKPLLKHGITPDLSVTIDPEKCASHYENKKSLTIPLVAYPFSNSEIICKHKATKYFLKNDSYPLPNDKTFRNMPTAMSCGSVTSDAMHVATLLGYSTIVFVGLDLAYTNDKSYADGTVNHCKSVLDGFHSCIDINGELLPTTKIFNLYRKWIERYIKARPGIKFYDCTEGGARIKGTELMTLHDFIKENDNGNERIS